MYIHVVNVIHHMYMYVEEMLCTDKLILCAFCTNLSKNNLSYISYECTALLAR